jgi:hypothetical protein
MAFTTAHDSFAHFCCRCCCFMLLLFLLFFVVIYFLICSEYIVSHIILIKNSCYINVCEFPIGITCSMLFIFICILYYIKTFNNFIFLFLNLKQCTNKWKETFDVMATKGVVSPNAIYIITKNSMRRLCDY